MCQESGAKREETNLVRLLVVLGSLVPVANRAIQMLTGRVEAVRVDKDQRVQIQRMILEAPSSVKPPAAPVTLEVQPHLKVLLEIRLQHENPTTEAALEGKGLVFQLAGTRQGQWSLLHLGFPRLSLVLDPSQQRERIMMMSGLGGSFFNWGKRSTSDDSTSPQAP